MCTFIADSFPWPECPELKPILPWGPNDGVARLRTAVRVGPKQRDFHCLDPARRTNTGLNLRIRLHGGFEGVEAAVFDAGL